MRRADISPSFLLVIEATLKRLFGKLPDPLRDEVIELIRLVSISRDELLYTQGESGSSMHIVLTGKLDVSVAGADGSRRIVAVARAGEAVGEMALLTRSPRAATLCAARDCVLAEIPGEAFDNVLRHHPQALSNIAGMIIRRLTQTDTRSSDQISAISVAIIPAGSGAEAGKFCTRLARELLHIGSTLHLTSSDIRQLVPTEDTLARNEFLEHASHRYDFLVFEGDPEDDAWNRVAIGFVDRIFVVARADTDPRPQNLELRLLGNRVVANPVQTELILLYPKGSAPAQTRRWLESREVSRHYHVPLDGEQGLRRIARNIAQASIGVVFAGGGARGFAHLGVIRALAESGVAIDAVGGTSFGAIAATGPARGFDIESMIDEIRHVFMQERPLDDYTLPMVSLVHGERLDALLQKYLDIDIEDLWLPYFAVSSNLTKNRVEVHESGSLWRAVRASISLPAILPPVIQRGDLLIDGGVLNNLPVDVMSERINGQIIAVDLSAEQEAAYAQSGIPTGMEYLKSRLFPWREPIEVPTLARVIMKTTTLASRREVEFARRMAHLYLNVPISEFDLLDWNQFQRIVDVGYRYAGKAIEDHVARNPRVVRRHSIGELISARSN
ncbi:MAG: patatin-like phospholipase family protein [Sulfuritalea sp.]|nr:patatin-like phospholipase family protein [Sulfuritalea sp.]